MPEIDDDDEIVEIARPRLQALIVLFALAYIEIALALILATFSIIVPRLFMFLNIMLFASLVLFILLGVLITGYVKLYEGLIISPILKFLDRSQSRDTAVAIQMLRDKIRASAWPKFMLILSLLVYISSAMIFEKSELSISGIILLVLIIIIVIADEGFMGYRIARAQYADNESEIRELLAWIVGRSRRQGGWPDPPTRILPFPRPSTPPHAPGYGADEKT